MKTVVFQGYEFQVPASWPVYRLDQHPQTCVRYDVHAVYLGPPGPNMQCPAGIIGRTQTVSFIPGAAGAAGGASAAGTSTGLQRLPAVHGVVMQNAVDNELSVTLGATPVPAARGPATRGPATSGPAASGPAARGLAARGATILGTYGTDPAVIEQVLNSVRQAPADAAQSTQTGSASALGAPAASARRGGLAARSPAQVVQSALVRQLPPKRSIKRAVSVGGFDTCTVPSLKTMNVWRSNYAVVGVYLGGVNAACAFGNLAASWVQPVMKSGWGILPTYVGPQAPCWTGSGVRFAAAKAAAAGKAAGADAVHQAQAFGLHRGSPIYDDMESYNGAASCTTAVLTFLSAWNRQVAAAGYVTGMYSSRDSGIADIQAAAVARKPGFVAPNAIWIAQWDGRPTLSDGSLTWPLTKRSKQYAGNVRATFKGVSLIVDKDIVGGPVAHSLTPQVARRPAANQFARTALGS